MVNLYKCAFTGIEMFSDAFPTEEMFDGTVFAVKSSALEKKAMKFDIGDCDDVDDQDEQVNDIIDGFKYNLVTLTKATFQPLAKGYLKLISERIKAKYPGDEDKVKHFQKNSVELMKFILGKFDEFEFYLNEENNTEGAMTFAYWQDSALDKGPTFLYLKDGLEREKI